MGWITVYITGKTDFREDVNERLIDSDLKLMPGYTGGTSNETSQYHDLYWVDEKVSLREIKEAIGSKVLFKHRLRFYTSLEAFIESQSPRKKSVDFSPEEKALLDEIKASYYREAS